MKYCDFKEIDRIKQFCEQNPYLYTIIDPASAPDQKECGPFDLSQLYHNKIHGNLDKVDEATINNCSAFCQKSLMRDLQSMPTLLEENKQSRYILDTDSDFIIDYQDGKPVYFNELRFCYMGGVVVDIQALIKDLSNPTYSRLQKQFIIFQYHHLLQFACTTSFYTYACTKIQKYLQLLYPTEECNRELNNCFGYIYQTQVAPTFNFLQQYFLQYDLSVEKFLQNKQLYHINRVVPQDYQLDHLELRALYKALNLIDHTDTTGIVNNEVRFDLPKQTNEQKINNLLRILHTYNQRINKAYKKKISVPMEPYQSIEQIRQSVEKVKQEMEELTML